MALKMDEYKILVVYCRTFGKVVLVSLDCWTYGDISSFFSTNENIRRFIGFKLWSCSRKWVESRGIRYKNLPSYTKGNLRKNKPDSLVNIYFPRFSG